MKTDTTLSEFPNGGIATVEQVLKKLWPLFMDGVQLSQGYRGDSLLFTTQFPGFPGTQDNLESQKKEIIKKRTQ